MNRVGHWIPAMFCGFLALIASGLAAGCRAYPRVVESPFATDDEYPQLF